MHSYKKAVVIIISAILFLTGAFVVSAQSSEDQINKIERGLSMGSSGKDVSALQRLLSSDPTVYPEALITGFFGRLTHKAVQVLQERLGFDAVGNVGPKTRSFLNGLLTDRNPTLLLAAAGTNIKVISLKAPTSLTASAVSSQSAQLGWYDTNTKEGGYQIERSLNSLTNFTVIATTNANAVSYLDTGLTASTTYYYRVRAFKVIGNVSYSAYSNVASVTTSNLPDITPPTVPTSISATASSCSQVVISWSASTDAGGSGLQGYNVYRNNSLLTTIFAPSTSISDAGLASSTTYTYTVSAFDQAGNQSAQSVPASATTPSCPLPPQPIALISADATSIAYNTGTTIQWSSTNATSCLVSPSGWTGTSGAQSTGNLTASATYVLSCAGVGGSATSTSVTVSVGAPPQQTNTLSLALVLNAGNAYHLAGGRTVSVLDTLKNQVVKTISLGGEPANAAMTKDGRYAYITTIRLNYTDSVKTVYKIDLATFNVTTLNIPLDPVSTFLEIEVSPDDQYVVVVDATRTTAHFFRVADDALLKSLTLCPSCVAPKASNSNGHIAFSPDSQHVYIGTPLEGLVYDIALPTQTVLTTLPFSSAGQSSSNLHDMKWNQRTGLVYTDDDYCNNYTICSIRQYDFVSGTTKDILQIPYSSRIYGDITVLPDGRLTLGDTMHDAASTTLMIVDPVTLDVVQIPSSGPSLRYMRYDPIQNTVWAVCSPLGLADNCGSGKIDIFSLNNLSLLKTIIPSNLAFGFGHPSFSQDGKYFYMNDAGNARVIVVDTATYAISFIPVGSNPRGVFLQGDNRAKAQPGA